MMYRCSRPAILHPSSCVYRFSIPLRWLHRHGASNINWLCWHSYRYDLIGKKHVLIDAYAIESPIKYLQSRRIISFIICDTCVSVTLGYGKKVCDARDTKTIVRDVNLPLSTVNTRL